MYSNNKFRHNLLSSCGETNITKNDADAGTRNSFVSGNLFREHTTRLISCISLNYNLLTRLSLCPGLTAIFVKHSVLSHDRNDNEYYRTFGRQRTFKNITRTCFEFQINCRRKQPALIKRTTTLMNEVLNH
jgi:hypothetical protein